MNRNFILLAIAVFCLNVGFGIYFGTFNNFIKDQEIGIMIERAQLGSMEGLRETPGFLSAAFNALVTFIAAPIIGGLSLILMGLGIGGYAYVHTLPWLVFFSLVWSLGFHGWAPLQGTMALAFSEEGKKGKRLGQLRSIGGLAHLSGLLLAYLVAVIVYRAVIYYKGVYLIGGSIIVFGGMAIFWASRQTSVKRERKFLLKKDYTIYYILNFFGGCRKQILVVFASFTLVDIFKVSVKTSITLKVINQVVTLFTGQLMGTLVDKHGERKMLSLCYLGLTFAFLGYALAPNRYVFFAFYFLDNFLNFGAVALNTYINKIAPSEDIRPTLSMGVTMNHIAAVITPLVGGFVWQALGDSGYKIIFLGGAGVALISLLVALRVKPIVSLSKKSSVI